MATTTIFDTVTPSYKKAYTSRLLGKALCAIDHFGYGSEGIGGYQAWRAEESYPGTNLRAPHMPLYNRPRMVRRSMLLALATLDLIAITFPILDQGNLNFRITEKGKEAV